MSLDEPENTQIVADTTPLRAGGANFKTHQLVAVGERRLILKSNFRYRFASIISIGLGIGSLTFVSFAFPPSRLDNWIFDVGCFFCFLFVSSGLEMAIRRHDFNRDRGSLGIRSLFRPWSQRPISDVIAVQVIQGGWHVSRTSEGGSSSFLTYQLNLVLKDPKRPRINLTNHSDWDATWADGQRLAEFLEVPLLDEAAETEDDEPPDEDGD